MTKQQVVQKIKQLEIAYCNDVNTLGVEGWLKYLADDCIFTTSGHHKSVKGKDTIKKRLDGLYKSDKVMYHWDVEYVDVSDDFTMAYSYSLYTYKVINKDEKKVYIGKDCNIWKNINGKYKVVMQIGNRIETTFDAEKRSLSKTERLRPYKTLK